jgi:hypothetical protein
VGWLFRFILLDPLSADGLINLGRNEMGLMSEISDEKNTFRKGWGQLLGTEGYGWLLTAVLINGILILLTARFTLQSFSLSPDEYAYRISAQLFTQGKLSVPSPQPPGFFDTLGIVNHGTYYSKYPPGWPLLLACGLKLGLDWLVNPIFGILTLVVLFALARALFSPAIANITMILTLACPYFIFNSACFLSHASCLLFITLAVYLLMIPEKNFLSFLGFGMLAGFAFLIRPFTVLLALAPFVFYLIFQSFQQKQPSVQRGLLFGSLPTFIFFIALFLLYNYAQTSHPLLQPFEVYNPNDRLGFFDHTLNEYWGRFSYNILQRSADWIMWTSGIPLLALVFIFRGKLTHPVYQQGLLFGLSAAFLLVGYYFYAGPGPFQYGPRYLYESFAFMLVPAAIGVLSAGRFVPFLLIFVLFLNGIGFIQKTFTYKTMTEDHIQFFKDANQLSNAVIFIHSSDYDSSAYFTRNGLDFKGPVLLLLDLGDKNNRQFMRLHPDRSFYFCDFDTSNGKKLFEPYNPQ